MRDKTTLNITLAADDEVPYTTMLTVEFETKYAGLMPIAELIKLIKDAARDWCRDTPEGKAWLATRKFFTWLDVSDLPPAYAKERGFEVTNVIRSPITVPASGVLAADVMKHGGSA